jgi:hypothetical protein
MNIATAETRLFIHRIAEHWAKGSKAPSTPDDMRWRGSQAGKCARNVAYETLNIPKSDPPSTSAYWRMGLGSVVHSLLEPAIKAWLDTDDTVEIEEETTVKLGEHGYGHVDLVLRTKTKPSQVIVLELKTINGMGYKMSVENGQGPRHSHVLQGALYANALNADLLVIGYLSMENISPARAEAKGIDDIGRFATEWHYTPDEFVVMAEQETARLAAITDQVHETKDPTTIGRRFSHSDPDVPFPAEITDPATGRWEYETSYGRAWQCRYCDYQTRCVADME